MRVTADRKPHIAYETVVRRRSRRQPWLVMLSGVGHDRHSWAPVVDGFTRCFRLVLIDNRGVGDSGSVGQSEGAGGFTVATLAGDVLAVLDDLGLHRVHLLGFSLGGMMAQEIALRASERVDRLVLVATTPGAPGRLLFPAGNVTTFWRALLNPGEESLRRIIERGLSPTTLEERPEILEQVLGYRLAHPASRRTVLAQSHAGSVWRGPTPFSPVRVPTLIVQGADDRIVDPGNVDQLVRVYEEAEVALLPDTGHLVPWEQPECLVDTVTVFLRPPKPLRLRVAPAPTEERLAEEGRAASGLRWLTAPLRRLLRGAVTVGRRIVKSLRRLAGR